MTDSFDSAPVTALTWALDIYSPTGTFVKTITQATSPNPIMGSPTAIVDACARTVELRFNAKQSLIEIEPRQVIRYKAAPGSVAVASGVVVTCPPTDSAGAGPADSDGDALQRISCVGLEQLLRESIVGSRMYDDTWASVLDKDLDVSSIAFDICDSYAHPALTIDASNFPASGLELGSWYSPGITVFEAALTIDASNFPASGLELGSWYSPGITVFEALENLMRQIPAGGCFRVNPDFEVEWNPEEEVE